MSKLYEPCPLCDGTGTLDGATESGHQLTGECFSCRGRKFVETGLTTGQVDQLVAEAKRFYNADGSFEVIDYPAEVTRRRIAAAKEIDRLRAAIREHRDQRGDDRCWMDDLKLYAALGEGQPDPYITALPPKADMLESCRRYIRWRQCPSVIGAYPMPGGMTIAQLTAECERLMATNAEFMTVCHLLLELWDDDISTCPGNPTVAKVQAAIAKATQGEGSR